MAVIRNDKKFFLMTDLGLIVRPKKKKLQMSKHITEEQRYAISMMLQIPMSKKSNSGSYRSR